MNVKNSEDTKDEITYSRSNSTKSPASDAGNVSQPRLNTQVGRVREVVYA